MEDGGGSTVNFSAGYTGPSCPSIVMVLHTNKLVCKERMSVSQEWETPALKLLLPPSLCDGGCFENLGTPFPEKGTLHQ